MQLKQNKTVVQFLLMGKKSMKDAQTMICLLEAVDINSAITICASLEKLVEAKN